MATTYSAPFGVAGLSDVGYTLMAGSTVVTTRSQAGVTGDGYGNYEVSLATLTTGQHLLWDSPAVAGYYPTNWYDSTALEASIETHVTNALTAQGYTTARAGYLDTLNGLVAAMWTAVVNSPGVTTLLTRIPAAFSFTGSNVNANAQALPSPAPAGYGPSASGNGSVAVTIQVRDDAGVNLPNIPVTLVGTAYAGMTGAGGTLLLNLNPGTYTPRIPSLVNYATHSDVTFTVPSGVTFTPPIIVLTRTTIAAPADPAQTTAHCQTRDAGGTLQGGVTIDFVLLTPPMGAGTSYATVLQAKSYALDDADASLHGVLSVALLRNATYKAKRDDAVEWITFTTPDAASYALPQTIGQAGC